MVAGQVKGAGAARDAGAVADGHQPFVLDQQLAGFAILGTQLGMGRVDLANDLVQHIDGNHRVVAVGVELLALAFQILEQIGFQIAAGSHVHHLEQGGDGKVVVNVRVALQEYVKPAQQILQAEVGSHTFVEGVLVNNHGSIGLRRAVVGYQSIV